MRASRILHVRIPQDLAQALDKRQREAVERVRRLSRSGLVRTLLAEALHLGLDPFGHGFREGWLEGYGDGTARARGAKTRRRGAEEVPLKRDPIGAHRELGNRELPRDGDDESRDGGDRGLKGPR